MSDNTENTENVEKTVYFPEQDNFKFLLIKNKDISNIRFDDPEYKKIICSLDCYEQVESTSSEFFNILVEKLELKNYESFGLNTQVIGNTPEYLYEMIHIDLPLDKMPTEIYNGVGNLLKMDQMHIFGNVVMIKTLISENSEELKMVNCSLTDLHDLLEQRVRHYGVSVDDDGEINEFDWYYEDPKKYIEEFMMNDHKFVEKAFLLHNLQIYYTPGSKDDFEELIGEKYDQLIILTKLTDYFYGNFKLKEFNDIKELLKTDCPLECPEEWKTPDEELKKKLENEKRTYTFNKYKALYRAKKEYL